MKIATWFVGGMILIQAWGVLPIYAADADIALPAPRLTGPVSVEQALAERRSVRDYTTAALGLPDVGQLLWAAQGITDPASGKRTAPSARALYLLKLYVVAENVTGLPNGVYLYQPKENALHKTGGPDQAKALLAAGGQAPLKKAAAVLVFTGDSSRSQQKDWMYLEAGHAAQNVYLQAVPLKIGTVTMAGFTPAKVQAALGLPNSEQPIYLMPLGHKP